VRNMNPRPLDSKSIAQFIDRPFPLCHHFVTRYVPLTKDMASKNIDVVVLGLKDDFKNINSKVWITTYNIQFEERELVLYVK